MSNRDQEKIRFTPEEDQIVWEYVKKHGERKWNEIEKRTGIKRDGKSCYNRWAHHLKPGLKKGPFTDEEERLIVKLHAELGNQWAKIAQQLPGRTNYDIKNFWTVRTRRLERDSSPQVSQQIPNDSEDVRALPTTSQLIPSQAVGVDDLDLFDYAQFFHGDDDVDLSNLSGDENEEGKKSAKKKESGKSWVLLDVKPWDNGTDMSRLEAAVRSVDMPGLFWGASKRVPVGNGIQKLQIEMNLVEGLVSVETLIKELLTAEPSNKYIQSCEIVALDKI